MGLPIPVFTQSIPTWILPGQLSLSVCPFLALASSRGRDWLCLFWLGGLDDKSWSLPGWCPCSTFRGVISGRGAHSSSFRVSCVLCLSRSKTETFSEAGWLPGVVQGEPFRHLCRCSWRAASAAGSTGGRSASFRGRTYRSNICVAAAATPRATVAANSGVDIDPGAVRALALRGTWCVSGPLVAILSIRPNELSKHCTLHLHSEYNKSHV